MQYDDYIRNTIIKVLCFSSLSISTIFFCHDILHSWRTEDGIYLAYVDFHSYLLVDASCMKELNQWFSKQLDTVQKRIFSLLVLFFLFS